MQKRFAERSRRTAHETDKAVALQTELAGNCSRGLGRACSATCWARARNRVVSAQRGTAGGKPTKTYSQDPNRLRAGALSPQPQSVPGMLHGGFNEVASHGDKPGSCQAWLRKPLTSGRP